MFEVGAESVQRPKTIEFTTPNESETPISFTLIMKWRSKDREGANEETDWAHFLVVPKNWKAGPGMQTVP
jgi:hypothetical protein